MGRVKAELHQIWIGHPENSIALVPPLDDLANVRIEATGDSRLPPVQTDPVQRRELVYQAYDVLEKEMPSLVGGWRVDGHMWWPYVKGFPSTGPEMGRYVFFDRQTLWLDK